MQYSHNLLRAQSHQHTWIIISEKNKMAEGLVKRKQVEQVHDTEILSVRQGFLLL